MKNEEWKKRVENPEEYTTALYQRTDELYQVPDSIADENGMIEGPVLTMREIVVFPRMVSPIYVSPGPNLVAINYAQKQGGTMISLVLKNGEIENPKPEDYESVGVEVAVGRLLNLQDGNGSALVQGRRRVQIVKITDRGDFKWARVRVIEESPKADRQTVALMRSTRDLFERCVQLDRSLPDEAHLFSLNISEPGWLADMVATAISLPFEERLELLSILEPKERLKRVNWFLAQELDVLQLEDEIQTRVQSEVDRSQREYYLREQLKAIQTELGEGDPWSNELAELNEAIEKKKMPEEIKAQALKEVEHLSQMAPLGPEAGILRGYIDWLVDLPWSEMTEDNLDVAHAGKILEENHYGLAKAKDRILEYIAVKSLKPKKERQPILCFVGPPGTGKTSLGQSIATALGRKFVRLSLGGVRDEAEIRGHRRTYIGALPGRIIQTMKRAGTINPLFMLDEIDKIGSDYRGDPSSALLEVLDPEQNFAFSDHYLEVAYDLSKVMFITTANNLSTVPPALLDRMEIIEFPGYIEEEKIEIARRFLIPRQLEESGLGEHEISFDDKSLQKLIREYTYEAGVRNLEREIGGLCRKIARLKSEHKRYGRRISVETIEKFLGPPEFFLTEAERKDEVGVATAVAWTENGGDIMPVEVLIMEGKGNLQVTGQIGDVMQESAQAALSFMKSRAETLGIDPDIFEDVDIHIHIPEGAIPKDGPSAGITMAAALISAFTDRKVKKEIAMTGEITLRGNVLPVGGIREKVLAAHRAGLKTILLPEKNKKDLVEVPRKVREDVNLVFVNHMDEVIELALREPEPSPDSPVKKIARKTTRKRLREKEA
jgi:ATP-dependent Lon protease